MSEFKVIATCVNAVFAGIEKQDCLKEQGIKPYSVALNHSQDPELVINTLKDFDYVIAGSEVFNETTLPYLPKLKLILRFGVGYDSVDLACAAKEGIAVANLPGSNAKSVAEHALSMMLALGRNLEGITTNIKNGGYTVTEILDSLQCSTVGLIGFGAISRRLAHLLSVFEANILAYDPFVSSEDMQAMGVQKCTLDDLLSVSDFISMHLPCVPETTHMVNDEFLAKMKKGSYLINTSRGRIVDEAALIRALESGHLKGAGLDVFENEPLPLDSPLRRQQRILLTPHYATASGQCFKDVMAAAAKDIAAFHQGLPITSLLNPEYIENVGKRQNPNR